MLMSNFITATVIVLSFIFIKSNVEAYVVREEAISFIKGWESFSPRVYKDGTQQSIGYGMNIEYARSKGFEGEEMDLNTANRLLKVRVDEDIKALRKLMPNFRKLPEEVKVALISMYYNCQALIGPRVQEYVSTRNKRQLLIEVGFGHNPKGMFGLVRRRMAEAKLISEGFDLPTLPRIQNMDEFKQTKKTLNR